MTPPTDGDCPVRPATGAGQGASRRSFLLGAGAVGTGLALGADVSRTPARAESTSDAAPPTEPGIVAPLFGPHQANLLHEPAPATAVIAFDVIATGAAQLGELFATITDRFVTLSAGEPVAVSDPSAPTVDNGILGPSFPGGRIGVTMGVGASLFDERFGLAPRKPLGLTPMTVFPNDDLDPTQTHGDLSVQLTAASADVVIHALRDITKHTRGGMQPRWRVDGSASPPRPAGTPRNLLGFKDGTANPSARDAATMDHLIWDATDGSQPTWTRGGTYQVIRKIRHLSEFWDRVSLQEQELMIGRRRDNGAPLDGNTEFATPDYRSDPRGQVIPLSAHIRLANPRTPQSAPTRILRRGWNYDLGLDTNGNLDQGMIFTCYQQDIQRQFEAVQRRLIDEPLVDYVSPVGGGYFFVLPGLRDRRDRYASALLSD